MLTKYQRKKLVIVPIFIIASLILWTGIIVISVNVNNNEWANKVFCEKVNICRSKTK